MSDIEAGQLLRLFRCDVSFEYAKRVMAHHDLRFALECLLRLRHLNKQENTDEITCEALLNAAIIRFFSVFDGPNALKLDILKELPEGAQEAFDFFNTYRDKHII